MRLGNSGKLRKPSERLSVEQADDPTTTERSPVDGPEELTGWGSKAAGEAAEADRGTPPALCGSDDVDRAHGQSVAEPAGKSSELAQRLSALAAVGAAGLSGEDARVADGRARSGQLRGGRDLRAGACARHPRTGPRSAPSHRPLPQRADQQGAPDHRRLGFPVRFVVTGGERNDITQAPALIPAGSAEVICDRGCGADWWRERLVAAGFRPDSRGRRNRFVPPLYVQRSYRARHLAENAFARLRSARRIATRYDQTVASFFAFVSLACVFLWLMRFRRRALVFGRQSRPSGPLAQAFAAPSEIVAATHCDATKRG